MSDSERRSAKNGNFYAGLLDQSFKDYDRDFSAITRRAAQRFRERDWTGAHRDAVERIELYDKSVNAAVAQMQSRLGNDAHNRSLWRDIRKAFTKLIDEQADKPFFETYFNSVTRRLFKTVGVDVAIEFTDGKRPPGDIDDQSALLNHYPVTQSLPHSVSDMLQQTSPDIIWHDFESVVDGICRQIESALADLPGEQSISKLQFLSAVFYRDYRAYLVGVFKTEDNFAPLVIALRNTDTGLQLDGLITSVDELSILFGFARSYIHADLHPVRDAMAFLQALLPHKPVSELYTVLGRAKQGKTERYRKLVQHLESASDQFVDAALDKGMVMIVFTPRDLPVVIKVIRDRFASAKEVVRKDVLDRYRLVFQHDRVGRLVDAQEFRGLKFPRHMFSSAVLDELMTSAKNSTRIEGDDVVLAHAYVERKLTPLNRFISISDPRAQRNAILDYGFAIRDLALSNIFPGDLLLKNFGITRHGRVIFYDYDELCLVTDCNFREFPTAATHEEEMSGESWFYVADNDVFPEQFINFLGLDETLKEIFLNTHQQLMTAAFWRDIARRIKAGEIFEVLPYRRTRDN